jgi:hypothetical protein
MILTINNEPLLFSIENIEKICKAKDAKYVCDTTLKNGKDCSIFYAKEPHPESNSRYFGMYYVKNDIYICNASDVEDQQITGVIADNGDIIYSRFRHDYRKSDDGSVWIDGGRDYTRCGMYDKSKFVELRVKNGSLSIEKSS